MGRFVNAYILAEDDPSLKIEFQTFIESLSFSMTANYRSHDTIGRAEPYRVYSASGPQTYNLTLNFLSSVSPTADTNENKRYIISQLAKLTSLTLPRKKGYFLLPPSVVFLVIGSFVNDRCIIKNVSTTFNASHPWHLETASTDTTVGVAGLPSQQIDPPVIDSLPIYASVSLSLEAVRKIPPHRDQVLKADNPFKHSTGFYDV